MTHPGVLLVFVALAALAVAANFLSSALREHLGPRFPMSLRTVAIATALVTVVTGVLSWREWLLPQVQPSHQTLSGNQKTETAVQAPAPHAAHIGLPSIDEHPGPSAAQSRITSGAALRPIGTWHGTGHEVLASAANQRGRASVKTAAASGAAQAHWAFTRGSKLIEVVVYSANVAAQSAILDALGATPADPSNFRPSWRLEIDAVGLSHSYTVPGCAVAEEAAFQYWLVATGVGGARDAQPKAPAHTVADECIGRSDKEARAQAMELATAEMDAHLDQESNH